MSTSDPVAEPQLARIKWRTAEPSEEWIEIVNAERDFIELTGLELSRSAPAGEEPLYRFPLTAYETPLGLPARGSAFVVTGRGQDGWRRGRNGAWHLHLFMNRAETVWNEPEEVALLRRANGTLIGSRRVCQAEPRRGSGGLRR